MTQARHSFVAAKCDHKVLESMTYKGTCNTALFEKGIEKILLPELSPGQLIIIDNATFHKSKRPKPLWKTLIVDFFSCRTALILIPLNDFGHGLKDTIREVINTVSSLEQAVNHVFNLCTC